MSQDREEPEEITVVIDNEEEETEENGENIDGKNAQKKSDERKELLIKKKKMLEQEGRALRSSLLHLRNQQRNLMLENERLKIVMVYRNKLRDTKDALLSGRNSDDSNQHSANLDIPS